MKKYKEKIRSIKIVLRVVHYSELVNEQVTNVYTKKGT